MSYAYGQDNNFQLLTLIFQHQLVSKCGSAHIGAGNFNHEAGISPQKTPFLGPALGVGSPRQLINTLIHMFGLHLL